jgi:outer membrane protein assembly factor BamB
VPRDRQTFVYIGIKGCVVALDREVGVEVWRANLRSPDYVTVSWDGSALFAANSGEVWRLDPITGSLVWHNKLKGLGRGLASVVSGAPAVGGGDVNMAEQHHRDLADAAASD